MSALTVTAATPPEQFRAEIRAWLEEQLSGPFAEVRRGAPGYQDVELRKAWERHMGAERLACLAWPEEYGGRAATLQQRIAFAEEYVAAGGPHRVNHIAAELAGPTILLCGRPDQKERFLLPIARGEELWCQGFSEPAHGSDLASVQTRAHLEQGPDGERWVVTGQKVWTSYAYLADWIFAMCRTEPGSKGAGGLSMLLIPMRQPGVTVRPLRQISGESHFCEVFFDGAVTAAENVLGGIGGGWRAAMATLGIERGVSTMGQVASYRHEFELLRQVAVENGAIADPLVRDRMAALHLRLLVFRGNTLRIIAGADKPPTLESYVSKLFYADWHQDFGELAMDVMGPLAEDGTGDWRVAALRQAFFYSRADSIYAGTHQIQRNIIGERGLGLPKER